jgi:hypothetical protein
MLNCKLFKEDVAFKGAKWSDEIKKLQNLGYFNLILRDLKTQPLYVNPKYVVSIERNA